MEYTQRGVWYKRCGVDKVANRKKEVGNVKRLMREATTKKQCPATDLDKEIGHRTRAQKCRKNQSKKYRLGAGKKKKIGK